MLCASFRVAIRANPLLLYMDIKDNKKSESELEVIFELDRNDIEHDLQKAAKRISENISISGFRSGQAPYDVVCRRLGGEDKVYEEALNAIVGRTLSKFVTDKKLEVAGQPKIFIDKMAPPFGVIYKAVVSLMPKIEIGDLNSIKVKKAHSKATEEEVVKVIDNLLESRMSEAAVSRAAQKGDKVVIDFEIKRDNVLLEHGAAKDYFLILNKGQFIPGFEENVVGLKTGEEKKFEIEFPKNYYDKNLAGKKADVSLKVKQVFQLAKPELDDTFARSLGGYESAAKFKEQVRLNLQIEKEREDREKFEMAVMDELVKLSKIGDFSEQMIKEETDKMIHELEHSISAQGGKMDDYLKSIKKTRADLAAEFKPKAKQRLKIGLVAREFGKQENIKIEEGEVAKEIEVSKKAYANMPEILVQFDSEDYKNYARNALTSRKIFEILSSKVKS